MFYVLLPGVPSDELGRNDWLGRFGPAIPSVDSAVESWDSSGLDPPPPGSTPALSKRDSGSDIVFRSGKVFLSDVKQGNACGIFSRHSPLVYTNTFEST